MRGSANLVVWLLIVILCHFKKKMNFFSFSFNEEVKSLITGAYPFTSVGSVSCSFSFVS